MTFFIFSIVVLFMAAFLLKILKLKKNNNIIEADYIVEDSLNLWEKYFSKRIVYVFRKNFLGKFMTICLFLDSEGNVLSRGISICSLDDNMTNYGGISLSASRAYNAFITTKNSERIIPRKMKNYTRRYNFKTIEERDIFIKDIELELERLLLPHEYSLKIRNLTLHLTIPKSYLLFFAKQYYEYKSEYQPLFLTEEEKQEINKRIEKERLKK